MNHQWDRDLYLKAWNFASCHHSGQKYGGPLQDQHIDYMTHIGMVSTEVLWAIQNSKDLYNVNLALQCAILHDTIEDTEVTYQDLTERFGNEVAEGVMALTKNENLGSKKIQMEDSLARIVKQPTEIWMVKMADRISNLDGAPYYWDNDKIRAYCEEAQLIYNFLHKANQLLADRLLFRISNYLDTNLKKI